MPEDEGKAHGYTQSALCTVFSLDDDNEANEPPECCDDDAEDDDDADDDEDDEDDQDDKHLGGHREECGDTKRHSSRDRVLVEPETHLSLVMNQHIAVLHFLFIWVQKSMQRPNDKDCRVGQLT